MIRFYARFRSMRRYGRIGEVEMRDICTRDQVILSK
jgi:hypothetical protein